VTSSWSFIRQLLLKHLVKSTQHQTDCYLHAFLILHSSYSCSFCCACRIEKRHFVVQK